MTIFPYETIKRDQKWTIVSDDARRDSIVPQGPKKFEAQPTDRIATAGSCFAGRIAERLPRFGIEHLVVERGAEPFSARYGNVYTTRQLRQLFSRAFGTFEPRERAWTSDSGRFVDPFRPYSFDSGFSSIDELEAERARHLIAVRRMFETADIFLFTAGLIETWSDLRDGTVFPNCPGRQFGTFDESRFRFTMLDVEANVAELNAFLDDLHAVNPSCRTILTVSPVPIAATMLPMHIVRASVLAKSTLKVAAESVARDRSTVDYFASYDLVTANLGAEDLFEPDGRHIRPEIADRVVEMFVHHYFEDDEEIALVQRPVPLGADCDEDRLLALLSERDGPKVYAPVLAEARRSISRFAPIYIFGDSTTVVYRDATYEIAGHRPRLAVATHLRRICASDFAGVDGRIHPSVLNALVASEVLDITADGSYVATRHVGPLFHREKAETPYVVFSVGMLDINILIELIGTGGIDIPDDVRPERYPARRDDDVSYERTFELASRHLLPFESALVKLQSFGLTNLAVHMVSQRLQTASFINSGREAEEFARTQGLIIVFNHALRAACERTGALFVDFSDDICTRRGELDERFALDPIHLNSEASAIAIQRTLEAFQERNAFD